MTFLLHIEQIEPDLFPAEDFSELRFGLIKLIATCREEKNYTKTGRVIYNRHQYDGVLDYRWLITTCRHNKSNSSIKREYQQHSLNFAKAFSA